ncbi:unnamed protein product [Cochlearia groenlandica]
MKRSLWLNALLLVFSLMISSYVVLADPPYKFRKLIGSIPPPPPAIRVWPSITPPADQCC